MTRISVPATLLFLATLVVSAGCGITEREMPHDCTTVRDDDSMALLDCEGYGPVYLFSENVVADEAERRFQNAALNWLIDERPLSPSREGCEQLPIEDVQLVLGRGRKSFLEHLVELRDSSVFGDGHGAIVYDLLAAPELAPEGLEWLSRVVAMGARKRPAFVREHDVLVLLTQCSNERTATFRAVAKLEPRDLPDEQVYSPTLGAIGLARLGHTEEARRALERAKQLAQNQTQREAIGRLMNRLNSLPSANAELRRLLGETLGVW